MTVSDLFENLCCSLQEVENKLAANAELNVLLVVLLVLLLHLFYLEPHLLRGLLDKVEERLDVQIAHNLNV